MNQTAIFWPMMAHVLLVFIIYAMLGLRRKAAVTSGSAKVSQFRENQVEPPQSLFVRKALANQFELPVRFHVVCLALYATGGATLVAYSARQTTWKSTGSPNWLASALRTNSLCGGST